MILEKIKYRVTIFTPNKKYKSIPVGESSVDLLVKILTDCSMSSSGQINFPLKEGVKIYFPINYVITQCHFLIEKL